MEERGEEKGVVSRVFRFCGKALYWILFFLLIAFLLLSIQERLTGKAPTVARYQFRGVNGHLDSAFAHGSLLVLDTSAVLRTGDNILYPAYADEASPSGGKILEIVTQPILCYRVQSAFTQSPEPVLVPAGVVVGRAVTEVPYLGYVLLYAETTTGLAVLIALPAVLALLAEAVKVMHRNARSKQTANDLKAQFQETAESVVDNTPLID